MLVYLKTSCIALQKFKHGFCYPIWVRITNMLSFFPCMKFWKVVWFRRHCKHEVSYKNLQPSLVLLLSLHFSIILEEASDEESSSSSVIFNCKDFVKRWQCPWISSVIDDIAPVFRHVLEGNYYSSSEYFLDSIRENTSLWWTQRNRLNECLCKFLQ